MTCVKCKRNFADGDLIQATVMSVYHVLEKPGMDEFKYAIDRPHAATNIKHLCCED